MCLKKTTNKCIKKMLKRWLMVFETFIKHSSFSNSLSILKQNFHLKALGLKRECNNLCGAPGTFFQSFFPFAQSIARGRGRSRTSSRKMLFAKRFSAATLPKVPSNCYLFCTSFMCHMYSCSNKRLPSFFLVRESTNNNVLENISQHYSS